jgi:hypothetical protein
MRLILGYDEPSLLVECKGMHFTDDGKLEFDFWVVNGCWDGKYSDGRITVYGPPDGDFSCIGKINILLDDQRRLRGHYQDVINNFYDPSYVGPEPKALPPEWDDDIPF